MIAVNRLTAVGAVLGLAAALTSSHVWGEPERAKELEKYRSSSTTPPTPDRRFSDDLAASRFAEQPFLVYTTAKGENYFALQLKPSLQAGSARPRDYAVLVDISASKAQGPLEIAKKLVASLVDSLRPADRLAIWTVGNDPRSLTGGSFKSKAELTGSIKELEQEYPSGASNLNKGFTDAVAAFEGNPARQGIILLLGDGKSLAGPIDADTRNNICDEMVKKEVACFTIPLGTSLEPLNLHGFPNATGGRCVRLQREESLPDFLARLDGAISVPVLYPHGFKSPTEATEVFPTRLPPLRSDVPALVVGKLKAGITAFAYRVAGTVAGHEVVVQDAPKVPGADPENFFLVNMVNQWREQKDRPALIQADRALAYAAERNQLARAEFVAKAEMALDQGMYANAANLYEQASHIDPTSVEARNGVTVARRMQELLEKVQDEQAKLPADKKLKVEDIRLEVRKRYRDEMQFDKGGEEVVRLNHGNAIRLAQADTQTPPPPPVPVPTAAQPVPPAPNLPPPVPDSLAEVKARLAVAEQQQAQIVEDAVRQADRLVQTDPNGARELLKRTLDSVRNNPDITDRIRVGLRDRLERVLADVDRRGAIVLRNQREEQELAARAAARIGIRELEQNAQDRIRERMRVFHNLMDQARAQEAFRQSLALRQDLISQGRPVPVAVTAANYISLTSYHLREVLEMRRLREERFLATMLQVEKSHVPFPDEPPVVFPPAAEWRALAELRKARYESSTLGAEMPKRTLELRDILSRPIKFDGIDEPRTTLSDALDFLASKYDVQFDVNEKAFKFENVPDVLKTEVANPPLPKMNASLGTILRRLLGRIQVGSGATFLIRRDTIEITTGQFATAEKALRVYPAADLVIPIPQSVNQQVVGQAATLFGFAGAVGVQLGVQLGAANAFGIGGALGALGALGGALGVGGIQIGGLGALGALGAGGLGALGALGAGGLGALGAGGLAVGGLGAAGAGGAFNAMGVQGGFQGNFQGANNLGVGGGAAGFGGGQLGQFGNLGGQFGLQGGDQSQILITLIRQVVGTPKDWLPAFNPITGRPINPNDDGDPTITGGENNQVAYFPPALGLVVKGTSRIQTRTTGPISIQQPAQANAGRPDRGEAIVRIGGNRQDRNLKDPDAASGDQVAAAPKKAVPDGPPPDPKKIWLDALAKGVNDPGLIIAVADYLALNGRFDHAAEFLKADLRQGIVVKPWVYQSLAVALRESGGSAEEIERAETAALELEPNDAQSYLAASRAMAKDKRFDRAVAFCRQASLLEPDVPYPYDDALIYAELAQDSKAMAWAAGNIVKQDWPLKNQELQAKAERKVESLLKELGRANRGNEAHQLEQVVQGRKQRDLVIKLSYQGDADLDGYIQEPTGSICSTLNRQTVGGGTLVGDTLDDMNSETYVAAQAFPGEYTITVKRIRGRSLGDRALLKIIQHQGTPEETEKLIPIDVSSEVPVKFRLEKGRRTEAAYVPPPAAMRPPVKTETSSVNPNHILTDLRNAADPEFTGVEKGFRGQATSPTATPTVAFDRQAKEAEPNPNDQAFYQTKIASFVKNSLDVTAQAVLSSDRRYVRVSLAPVNTPVMAVADRPVSVPDPLIPGSSIP